jgi:hypothetical protein
MATANPSKGAADLGRTSFDAGEKLRLHAAAGETLVAAVVADFDNAQVVTAAYSPVDQLARDVANIRCARDALITSEAPFLPGVSLQTTYPGLTTSRGSNDPIPVMLGCLFAAQIFIGLAAFSVFIKLTH